MSAAPHPLFHGPWAGLPLAWEGGDGRFDESAYRANVAACCRAGIPGVYTGGTTGEFYALEIDEFEIIARATVEECRAHGAPAMIGCTATSTRGAARRARIARALGAGAIQVALPFWMEVARSEIVPFFKEIAGAADGLPLSIYETARARRTLTLDDHRAVAEAVPAYRMVKATAGTLGATPGGCADLSRFVAVFVGEHLWPALVPHGARGGCSSLVYWNPSVILAHWEQILAGDANASRATAHRIAALHSFIVAEFGPRGFTDTAYDRLGGVACGFLAGGLHNQPPYPGAVEEDARVLRDWLETHFPEMLVPATMTP